MAIGLATIRLSDSPTTSPDVAFFIRVLIVLVMTLNAALRKMLPKLFLARSGKPVLINQLVTDHRIASQKSFGRSSTNAPSYTSTNSADSILGRQKSSNTSARFHSQASGYGNPSELSETEEAKSSRNVDNGRSSTVRFTDEEAQSPPAQPELNGDHKLDDSSSRRQRSKRIRIDDNHAPSRSLILKMMEVQTNLKNANQEINSGYAITHEEWANIREACVELGSVFRDDVKFEWEEKKEHAEEKTKPQ